MSTKHLRRLIEEKEQEQAKEEQEEEEDLVPQRSGPVNRFAAFVDDGDGSGKSDAEELQPSADRDTRFYEPLGVDQVVKPDPRLFDAAAELKRALGKSFKINCSSTNRSHRTANKAGKLVKQKHTWPPIRSIGEKGQEKWFKFVHNSHYEQLERSDEILTDNQLSLGIPFSGWAKHCSKMQEDITQSCDLIERGIFYCEQAMASTFHPSSFYHRVDYLDYENRAFYLLLHRHMLNCIHKR
ncbi:hypothetical protein COOONC_02460 [Cooperia oncophora]